MKKIKFSQSTGWGEHNVYTEIIEFEDDATEEQIQKAYEEWVWERIGDDFYWEDCEE